MNNVKFLEKRETLESFIREQILGPGALNRRYFLLKKWEVNEFKGKNLNDCHAINNVSEIITEVPAYQYSSGILFPKSSIATNDNDASNEEGEENQEVVLDEEAIVVEKESDEDLSKFDEKTENLSSKNQNYPNTCGLSFAVDKAASLLNGISVEISARKYKKVMKKDVINEKLGYWIKDNVNEIRLIIEKYLSDIFQIAETDGNSFIVCNKSDIIDELYEIDYTYLEKYRKNELLLKIHEIFPEKDLYEVKIKNYNNTDYEFSLIKDDPLLDAIKTEVSRNGYNEKILDLIKSVTIYHQVKDAVTDLKTIFKKKNPTPIWESEFFSIKLQLPDFEPEGLYRQTHAIPIKLGDSKNLHLHCQYIKHSNGKTYVKLILLNNNEIKLKRSEPPQLNMKDKANKLSLFGVKINVKEIKPNTLTQYNPPNLLDIDKEENFNKIIYRMYKDYGEGYNTSVDWGVLEDGLKYVSTEYLPNQDIPSVDYVPCKISEDKLIERIDPELLSIRSLSTLSDNTDEEILKKLTSFVDSYGAWVTEKKVALENDQSLNIESRDLLSKQLNGCLDDYKRLKRNVELLKDNTAITTFRIMNTAMFMQLHHGINTKELKNGNVFLPVSNSEMYYRSLIFSKDKEYKWRAFQLAFIILNIDGFVRPPSGDKTVDDVFGTGWPERNEIADLVWFPTGGGKTEAYLGIIAFCITYRRFTKGEQCKGTTVLMRYTLRLLTLQQFQRATLLICALEAIRKDKYDIPFNLSLGDERITIGLFVGADSLPNTWDSSQFGSKDTSMKAALSSIQDQIGYNQETGMKLKISTNLPHTKCPWCGGDLFIDHELLNISPKPSESYGLNSNLSIGCCTKGCTFNDNVLGVNDLNCLPLRLFDEDIYKYPPTLLFGTVDKFAALANKINTTSSGRKEDARRLFGRGYRLNNLPPELIIQDELHLLLGPLGSAVGLFEKAIDKLCTYQDSTGILVKPKIITSTATTRNTDRQCFALFNRRSEIFPKQGISCDDSFYSFYKRRDDISQIDSLRRYIGFLPIGKTQVWMQLRLTAIVLAHRLKYVIDNFTWQSVLENHESYKAQSQVFDYYHTVISYFNSLKEVGKTQSQLSHYLPGDLNLVIKNTTSWNFLDTLLRKMDRIDYTELTGRLNGEDIKTNMDSLNKSWSIQSDDNPPEFVIATNMISVGLDISRFNVMIISSMPRNTAEYIQATSRVAREKEGLVLTVHHPFRSRDLSHYQRYKEFHEKFYGYVEPISVTPFALKALERYLAMYLAAIIRHNNEINLSDNDAANNFNSTLLDHIKDLVIDDYNNILENANKLEIYLATRTNGLNIDISGILGGEEYSDLVKKTNELLNERWIQRLNNGAEPAVDLEFRSDLSGSSLFTPNSGLPEHGNWNVKHSLREIAPSTVIKTVQQ